MSTAALHHTRHEKSKAHDSVTDTLALFYCNSSITSKPNLINIHKKKKYKKVEVTKLTEQKKHPRP